MNSQKTVLMGVFWEAVSVLCWSTAFPVGSYLLQQRHCIDPVTLTAMRFLIGGVTMLGCYLLFQKKNPAAHIDWKQWCAFGLHGFFAALMSLLLFEAQKKIAVVNASMLEAEAPLVMFVLGIVIHKTRNSWIQITGLLLGFTGCLLVLRALDFKGLAITSLSRGDLLVFLSAVCWALYTVLARKSIQKVGGFLYSAWTLLAGGVVVAFYAAMRYDTLLIPARISDYPGVFHLALITTALAFFAWNNAQKYIPIGLLSISGYFTPAFAALLGWIFFHQELSFSQICGMALVFFSSLIEPEISMLLRDVFSRDIFKGKKEKQV